MSVTPESKIARMALSVLAAGSLLVAAVAPSPHKVHAVSVPDRVQSINRKPRLGLYPLCTDGYLIYPPGLPIGIEGKGLLQVIYEDAIGVLGQPRVLTASGEGYKRFESQTYRSGDGLPTRFEMILWVEPAINSDADLRFAVYNPELSTSGEPLVSAAVKPPSCGG